MTSPYSKSQDSDSDSYSGSASDLEPEEVAVCAAHLLIYIIWFFGYKFQMKITINNISRAFMPQTEALVGSDGTCKWVWRSTDLEIGYFGNSRPGALRGQPMTFMI